MSLYSTSPRMMKQLNDALSAIGYDKLDDRKKFGPIHSLESFHNIPGGRDYVWPQEHIIDCDDEPFVPNSYGAVEEEWEVEEHQKGGSILWSPERVGLYLSESQRDGRLIKGYELIEELAGKPLLNACALDDVLFYEHFIPNLIHFKKIRYFYIIFWNTRYRDLKNNSGSYVRCLYWNGLFWSQNWYSLNDYFASNTPAAVVIDQHTMPVSS